MTKQMTVWARIGVAVLLIGSLAGFNVSQASDMQVTQTVKQSVQCFSYARALDKSHEVQQVYLKRIGKASGTAGAVYHLGYTEGLLAGLASANAKVLGSYKAAKIHAAEYMYKLHGCTINESI